MKNRKGFTLIELIAVIVILGVIVLVATTSIGPLITRARKGALGEEGLHMIEAAKFAYQTEEIEDSGKVKGSSSKCYSLSYLNNNNYFDKGEKEGYTGSVLIEYDEETESYSYKFWLSNGTYVFNNVGEEVYEAELGKDGKTASENCGGQEDYEKDPTLPDPEPEPEPEPEEELLDVCSSPGVIKHDKTIDVNGDGEYEDAGDGGCRYSGNNPNNFICFGPGSENYNNGTSTTCPDKNLYRIIGYVPVQLPPNGTKENRIKVIKSEYVTRDDLGMEYADDTLTFYSKYKILKRVKADEKIDGFSWDDYKKNEWEKSTLYQALNTNSNSFLNNLENWANKIETVKWNAGWCYDSKKTPQEMYDEERYKETGAETQVSAKIGLMYPSDYGYASSKENWTSNLWNRYSTDKNRENNWLFNAVDEWTILTNSSHRAFNVDCFGDVDAHFSGIVRDPYGVRPVFYLKSSVTIKAGDEIDGSDSKPFKVS